ncbi:MAG: MFS transporter [Oscillospiraceae bacterium]|nr:MFS transporter [Oscillospiraceae bacterium]
MKDKIQLLRPAAAAFLTMMAMALTSSTLSFFLEPVCEDLQISRSSFSLIFSLMSVSGALINPFLGQFAGKNGVKKILLLSGLWVCGSLWLFSAAGKVWLIYLAGFCMGAFGTNCVALCANVIVQQSYFGPQASGILGAVMAGSGVGGMIFSLIIPGMIEGFGWQWGMRVMGIGWLALLWCAAILLGKENQMEARGNVGAVGLGMTRAEALRSPKLYLQMVVIIVITACCGIQQQLPSLLHAQGYESTAVSVMISVMTAFLAIGKVAQGLLYGKLGIKKGGNVMMVVFALGFLALLLPQLAWPGLLLLAFGLGIYTTLLPQVTRTVFGSREYAAIWALLATAGSAGTFVANPLWGMVYDLTGSYMLGLAVCPVLLAGALAAMNASMK